jgi:hypothetical protein
MEVFARGASLLIPHGMWYDPSTMHIPPEVSHRNQRWGDELPAYNRFVGRCSLLLQGGRHVADIGVLYPVTALQAAYRFDVPGQQQPNWGKDAPHWADYLKISNRLTSRVRRDFTFLHPQILDHQCQVKGSILRLDNTSNWEEYRVIIIPGGDVISWSNLQILQRFYDSGGCVIATTRLPHKSSELGHDADVQKAISMMFGQMPTNILDSVSSTAYQIRIEATGKTIKTYVKGVLVDVTEDGTIRQGGIGFRESNNEQGGISKLKVTATDGRILFQDSFDSGLSRWTNTTNAATSNGWLIVGENHGMRSRIGADWTDYVIEAELSTNHAPAGLVFRASADGKNHYMWQFWPAKEQLRPHKLVDGRYWVIKDIHCVDIDEGLKPFHVQSNANGGKAYFASNPTVGTLQAILDDALPVADVAFEGSPDISSGGGMLSYLHKVKDGANVYYIANSSNDPVDSRIRLRGNLKLQLWNPHTGSMIPTDCIHELKKNHAITSIRTVLKPVESIFLIEQ